MIHHENPFESGLRKVIPAVLVYLRFKDKILMIHRVSKAQDRVDYHAGKWNGLGGKCELDESSLEAAQREIQEEAGITLPLQQFQSLGVLQFPNFKAHRNEDWIVFVFACELTEEQAQLIILGSTQEGELHWVPAQELLTLSLWPGDVHFLPFVLERQAFVGTIWYQGSVVVKQWITALGAAQERHVSQ